MVFLLGLVLTAVLVLSGRPLVKFAGAIPGETLDSAAAYFKVISSFILFRALMLVINAALRGAGDTKSVALSNAVAIGAMRPVSAIVSVLVFDSLLLLWCFMVMDMLFRYFFLRHRFKLERWKYIKV